MKRVLVPLDESGITESILPYAQRVAGPDGEIILIHAERRGEKGSDQMSGQEAAETYLQDEAAVLASRNVRVRVKAYPDHNLGRAVEEGVREFDADMLAAATLGAERGHALGWGDMVWTLLVHSPIPVLLRHATASPDAALPHGSPHILVPLDGSEFGESALQLASELASQWQAPITLARVVHAEGDQEEAQSYLRVAAGRLHGDVRTEVLVGSPVEALSKAAIERGISDIIMSSHGRTGVPRMLLGSVAAGLIHALVVPIIVIPALAASREHS
jgi:nucleotide-binding universal stress UspA family protein